MSTEKNEIAEMLLASSEEYQKEYPGFFTYQEDNNLARIELITNIYADQFIKADDSVDEKIFDKMLKEMRFMPPHSLSTFPQIQK